MTTHVWRLVQGGRLALHHPEYAKQRNQAYTIPRKDKTST